LRTVSINSALTYIFSSLLLVAIVSGIYFHQPLFLFVPAGILFLLFTIQFPRVLFYILVASIPWSVQYQFSNGFATDVPDEPFMLLMSFAAIALLVYKRASIDIKKIHPLVWILIFQFLWLIVTVLFSTDVFLSTKFLLAKSWYLLAFVAAPLLLLTGEKHIRRTALILLVSMLCFVIMTLLRHEQYNWSFDKINNALSPFFVTHVDYSALLVFMVPLWVFAIRNTNGSLRLFLYGILLLTLVAVYFSYARGAWLALFTGYAGYWFLKRKLLFWAYAAGIILVIAAVFYLKNSDRYIAYSHDYKTTIFHTNFKEHLVATYTMKDVSTAERYYRWIAGVRMAEDSWKTGFGPNTFYYNYRSYTVPAFKTWVSVNKEKSTVHNYFLFLLIEQGMIGLLLFIILLGAMFWYIQRIYHRTGERFWKMSMAVAAAILVMVSTVNFLSDLIESDKVGSVFFLLVAIIVIADRKTAGSDTTPHIKGIS
jgi:O-antigen ligase